MSQNHILNTVIFSQHKPLTDPVSLQVFTGPIHKNYKALHSAKLLSYKA